jgi:hypothetical protein
LHYRPLTR